MPTITLIDTGNPVTNGTNLANAVNSVSFGDTIVIPEGAICRFPSSPLICPVPRGTVSFPPGDARNYVNVQSSGLANLPQPVSGQPWTGRIFSDQPGGLAPRTSSDPGVPGHMARLCHSAYNNESSWLLSNSAGARYWKFQGLEFCPFAINDPAWMYFLIYLGTGSYDSNNSVSGSASQSANYFSFDRCYVHVWDTQPAVKGMLMFGRNISVINSNVQNFKSARGGIYSGDAEAIAMHGPGPYTILNNYAESTHESVFFGWGSPPSILSQPGDGGQSVVQYNTIAKRLQWLRNSLQYQPPSNWPTGGFAYFLKNLLEIKAGYNILIDHNFFQYSDDSGDQQGSCFAINLINYSANGFEQAHDITFTNNRIDSCCAGVNVSHNEQDLPKASPGQVVKNLRVANNLFTNMGAAIVYTSAQSYATRFVMDVDVGLPTNLVFDHNTFVLASDSTWYGAVTDYALKSGSTYEFQTQQGFHWTNSIVGHGTNGWEHGLYNSSGEETLTSDDLARLQIMWPASAGCMIAGNVMFGGPDIWTTDNQAASSQGAVGFVSGSGDLTPANWALVATSPYKSKGTDNLDPGCDISKLLFGAGTGVKQATISLAIQPNPVPFGGTANATVTVAAQTGTGVPTGSVTISGAGPAQTANLSAGQAMFTIPGLAPGNYTVSAMYSGDSVFAGGTSLTFAFVVGAQPVTLQISGQLNIVSPANATVILSVKS